MATGEMSSAVKFARGLGWFSLGLGAAELFFPGQIENLIGVRNQKQLLRWMGAREIGAGIAVLLQGEPFEAMLARIGGDAVDLSLLGLAMASSGTDKGRVGAALGAVAGITALDAVCVAQLNKSGEKVSTTQTVAVNKTPSECYQFWRDFEKLPQFMEYLRSVRVIGDRESHWIAKGPAGMTVEWDAETTEDTPQRIAWRSLPGADVENQGNVEFQKAPVGHGTIVRATIEYKPPAGKAGATIAKLFGREPGMQTRADLRRFKAVIEAGEVPTIVGQSSGRVLSST